MCAIYVYAHRFTRLARTVACALTLLLALFAAVSAAPAQSNTAPRQQGNNAHRPNIVFILVDDLAYDAMGYTGAFPFLETPALDQLAKEGARFDNAFVTTSLCSPSRASFLSGQYAHRHGVWTNQGMGLDEQTPTFPKALQKHGYNTAFVGKWHMKRTAKPRPGFDYWLSFRGQGQYFNPGLNENGRDFKANGYMSDLLTDYAVKWLKRDRDKPFLLFLSHKAVHGPFKPPKRYKGTYRNAKIPKPASWSDNYAEKPRWFRRMRKYGWRGQPNKPVPAKMAPGDYNPSPKHRIGYFEALRAVDDSVGRVVTTLKAMGELEHTFIVFTSDNGFFIEEHRLGDKRLAYEPSIRIPMLVRYPKMVAGGTRIEPMALNIDVAPTLLDLAGAPVPESMQGRSLLPLLRGESPAASGGSGDSGGSGGSGGWREMFLYEYFVETPFAENIPTILAARTRRRILITTPYRAPDQVDEMYDLQADPHQLENLAPEAAHADQLKKMRRRLETLKRRTDYRSRAEALAERLSEVTVRGVGRYPAAGDDAGDGKLADASDAGHALTLRRRGGEAGANNDLVTESPHGPALTLDGRTAGVLNPSQGDLDPARKPLTVGGWVRPAEADGVVMAFGGESHGFSLYLEGGKPRFAVRAGRRLHTVKADRSLPVDQWTHLSGLITPKRQLRLFINGRPVGEAGGAVIQRRPNDGLSLGADIGSPVGDYDNPLHWQGQLADVRLYWGRLEDAKLREWAGE